MNYGVSHPFAAPEVSTRGNLANREVLPREGKRSAEGMKRLVRLERDAIKALKQHTWPGNVRELDHVIRAAVVASRVDRNADSLRKEWLRLHTNLDDGGNEYKQPWPASTMNGRSGLRESRGPPSRPRRRWEYRKTHLGNFAIGPLPSQERTLGPPPSAEGNPDFRHKVSGAWSTATGRKRNENQRNAAASISLCSSFATKQDQGE